MSLAPAIRSLNRRMTMRMDVERNVEMGKDAFNNPKPPRYEPHLTDQRCWVWSQAKRVAVSDSRIIVVEDLRAIVPLDTDVRAGDRIVEVRQPDGSVMTGDVLKVESIQVEPTHLELNLEEVT